jgi:hypothetical protein
VGAGEVPATIDTLRLAKRFKEAKLTDEQAELLAETFRETHEAELSQVATKADLALLREELSRRIDAIAADLGRRIDAIAADLGHRIDGVEAAMASLEERLGRRIDGVEAAMASLEERLGRRIDGLEAKLAGLEARLTIRLGGMLAAAVVLVGALVAIF